MREATEPSNKELKLTKPSIMELRSLTPVFGGPPEEGRVAGLTKTAVALASTVGALSVLWPPPPDGPGPRQANIVLIQDAVLADRLQDTRTGYRGHANPVLEDRDVCVSIWRTKELFIADADYDPAPQTLMRLRASGRRIHPGSACMPSSDGLVVRETRRLAVLICVGDPEWVRNDLVRVQGAWYLGPLYAAGTSYTVSFWKGSWRVDTATFTFVASGGDEAAEQADAADEAQGGTRMAS